MIIFEINLSITFGTPHRAPFPTIRPSRLSVRPLRPVRPSRPSRPSVLSVRPVPVNEISIQ